MVVMEERTAHVLDAIQGGRGEHESWLRHFLLHSRSIHVILVTLLCIDGLICLTCGVLESNFLADANDHCVDYIDKCVEKGHHRRLYDGWQPGMSMLDFQRAYGNRSYGGRALGGNAAASGAHWTPKAEDAKFCASVHTSNKADIKHSLGDHSLHDAEIKLTYISVFILGLFLLEQLTLIYELRREYCKFMFLLDLGVITSSILIETLVLVGSHGPGVTAALLVMARAWRFARVGHGVFEAGAQIEEYMDAEDEVVQTMKGAWSMLDDATWKRIRKEKKKEVAAELEGSGQMADIEYKVTEEVKGNPVAILRALAYAKAWKGVEDRRKLKKGTPVMKLVKI